MNEIFSLMQKSKVIPVATVEDASDATPLAKSLLRGGVKILEITYRTAAAARAISAVSAACPDILAGAGTVCDVSQAKEAVACGAKFIVSPGTNFEIVNFCKERGVAVIPGVATPTEISRLLMEGLEVLKFFPASLLGGPDFLDAMAGPFPAAKFVPTGGITFENAPLYLQKKNVLAVGGSWIVKKEFIEKKNWEAIAKEAERAATLAKD